MKRYLTIFGILLLALALLSCGGGSGTPDPSGSNGDRQTLLLSAQPPSVVSGNHAASVVPDQLNVLSGASPAQLEDVVAQYGYSVVSHSGGWATLQLPAGTDLQQAAATLEKEYVIAKAEPVNLINTPAVAYPAETLKGASFYPGDPFYADTFISLGGIDDTTAPPDILPVYMRVVGQGQPMNMMGFPGAWDVALNPAVAAQPVRIAVIDAGYFDYSVIDHPDLDETIIDAVNSAQIASDGTATTGLAAVAWDLWDHDGDANSADVPRRDVGERIFGMLAADLNVLIPRGIDVDAIGGTPDGVGEDEVWNEGMAGINPNATFILIKTGQVNGDGWSFSDNYLAESIDYLMALPEADRPNIILMGMFGAGVVGGNLSTAIQNARDNNVLVIAPAGDVIDSAEFDQDTGAFLGWADTPVDISVTPVSPASDPNIVSVTGTGYNRIGDLGDIDFGDGPIANVGRGWQQLFNPPFNLPWFEVATDYCNTGADIAAVGFGIGFGFHPVLIAGGTPPQGLPAQTFTSTFSSFSTIHPAAYVAGAASIVYQALAEANGVPPTDDEVLNELLTTAQFVPMTGLQGTSGVLNAGAAAFSAVSGGNLQTVLPAMTIESAILSQPLAAVTRGTDLSLTVTVADGTAPFKAEIDWGDGPVEVDPWTNGDPVTLTGGYEELGLQAVNMTITDANDIVVNVGFALYVINPLGMGITITDVTGATQGGNPVALDGGTQYRFNANPTNVFTGEIGGVPNVTTFSWDFNGDSVEDATGVSPVFAYPSAGDFTLTLTVTEAARPDTQWTVEVTVN